MPILIPFCCNTVKNTGEETPTKSIGVSMCHVSWILSWVYDYLPSAEEQEIVKTDCSVFCRQKGCEKKATAEILWEISSQLLVLTRTTIYRTTTLEYSNYTNIERVKSPPPFPFSCVWLLQCNVNEDLKGVSIQLVFCP